MRRRRTLAKVVPADHKIFKWFNENEAALAKIRDPYIQYWKSVEIERFRISRESYGGTKLEFTFRNARRNLSSYGIVNLPIEPGWNVSLGTTMDVANAVMPSILSEMWKADVPTYNRTWDNWYKAVWDNAEFHSDWTWIAGARNETIQRITDAICRYAVSEDTIGVAFELESARAVTRLIAIQKEFRHVPPAHWHVLVDLALVNSVHEKEDW